MTFVLDTTAKSIKVSMSGAAATTNPDFVATWADNNGTTFTEGASDGVLNGTTDVTVVAAPAASTRRIIKAINIENKDTAPVTVTVKYDSGTQRTIAKTTLAVGDTWTITGVYDTNGNFKTLQTTTVASLSVGSTAITGGTSGRVLYDNAGSLGELTTTGSGNVVLSTSPTLTSPALGTPTSLNLANATNLSLSTGVSGTLPATSGGTSANTYVTGDILYASAANVLSKLSVGSTGQVLTVAAGAPAWANASSGSGTVSNVATGTGLTGGPITTTGTISLATSGVTANTYGAAATVPVLTIDTYGRTTTATNVAIAIAASQITSGNLSVANGGTGNTSLTANAVLIGSGTNPVTIVAPGTTGNVLTSNGTNWISQAASSGGGGLTLQSVQTSNFAAVKSNNYPVNTTSAAITATLPASPSAGDEIQFVDYAGTFGTNSLTVNPNGLKIQGLTSNFVTSTNRLSISFIYVDSTQGWVPSYSYQPASYPLTYLVVAGGGGGGMQFGGGGGAGGVLTGSSTLTQGTVYSVTVGTGGAGSGSSRGASGNNSVLSGGLLSYTAIGGGGGGGVGNTTGLSGGSGGGSGNSSGTGGSGTTGQGYAGGTWSGATGSASGGGGAGAVGGNGGTTTAGAGGTGIASTITGSSVYYGGGGGGAYEPGTGGAGGTGGGGSGAGGAIPVTAGTANTGGGGGGGSNGYGAGGNGGSGVVILSVPTTFYSGVTTGSPTVTTSGGFTIIKFTASGSYTA